MLTHTHTHTHFHSPSNTSLNWQILSLGTPFGLCSGRAAILCQELHTKKLLSDTCSHIIINCTYTLQAAALHGAFWLAQIPLDQHAICHKSPEPNLPPCAAAVIHTETTRMWRVHATRETTVTTEDHAPAHAQHMQIWCTWKAMKISNSSHNHR